MDSTISAKLGLSHPAVDAQKSALGDQVRSPDLFEHFMQVSRGTASAKLTERSKDVTHDTSRTPKLDRVREEDDAERENGIDRVESDEDDDLASSDFVSADSTNETIAELEQALGEELVLEPSVTISQSTTGTASLAEIESDSSDGQTVETIVTLQASGTEDIQASTGVVQTTEQSHEVATSQPAITPDDQQLPAEATSELNELTAAPAETSPQANQEEAGQHQDLKAGEYLKNTGKIDSNNAVEAPSEKQTTESTLPSAAVAEAENAAGEQQQQASQGDDSKWYQEGSATPAPLEAPETDDLTQPLTQQELATEDVFGQSSSSTQDGIAVDTRPLEPNGPQQNTSQPNSTAAPTADVALAAAVASRPADAAVQTSTQAPGSSGLGSSPPVGGAGRTKAAANAAGANQTSAANEPDNITQHERIRLIQRVSRSFSRLTPTGGEITLRLHPPQLGSLAVKVQMEGNSLSARLSTESQAAREIIVENLPILRKRLAEQGIEVTQMHVDVSDSSSDTQHSSSGGFGASDSGYGDRAAHERTAQYRRALAGRDSNETTTTAVDTANLAPQTQPWVVASSIDVHA